MANDVAQPGMFNGMPIWVKIVYFIGFPAALSIGLIWWILTAMTPHITDTSIEHKLLRQAAESMAYTNQIMCQNAAVDRATAEKCVKPPSP